MKLQFNFSLVISVKLKVTTDLCFSAMFLPYTYLKTHKKLYILKNFLYTSLQNPKLIDISVSQLQ